MSVRPDVVGGTPGANWLSGDFNIKTPEPRSPRIDPDEHMAELKARGHPPKELLELMARFDREGRRAECDNARVLLVACAADLWKLGDDELAETINKLLELLKTRSDPNVLEAVRILLRALVPGMGLLSPEIGNDLVNVLCRDGHCVAEAQFAQALAHDLLVHEALSPEHIELLVDALTDKSLDDGARRRACAVLARRSPLSTDDDAPPHPAHAPPPSELVQHAEHLIMLLEHAASSVRAAAFQLLLQTLTANELGPPHEDSLVDLYFTHAHDDVRNHAGHLLRSMGAEMAPPPPQEPVPSHNHSAIELAAMLRHRDAGRRATALVCFEGKSRGERRNAADVLLGLLLHADKQVRGSAQKLLVQLVDERLFCGGSPSSWDENDRARIIALASLLDHMDKGVRSDASKVFVALDRLDMLTYFTVTNVAKHAREMLMEWLTSCPAATQVQRLSKIVDVARLPIDAGSFSAAARIDAVAAAKRVLLTLVGSV